MLDFDVRLCLVQCRGEFERDRQQLQTQLDTLRRHLAESRDRRDVTAADTQQLADSLAAAEQTAAQYRDALRAKVLRLPLMTPDSIMILSVTNNRIQNTKHKQGVPLGSWFRPTSATVVSAEPFSHGTGTLRCLQKEMATYRH